jgi:hypothetical protein
MSLKRLFVDIYAAPATGYITALGTSAAIASIASGAKVLTSFCRLAFYTAYYHTAFTEEDQWMSWKTLAKVLTTGAYVAVPLAFEAGMHAAKDYFLAKPRPMDTNALSASLGRGWEASRSASFLQNILSGAAGIGAHYIFSSMLTMLALTNDERNAVFTWPVVNNGMQPIASIAGKAAVTFAASLPLAALGSQATHAGWSHAARYVDREILGHRHAL